MLPSETELKERYASYSNHRLLAIVQHKAQYTAQAVEIAKAELAGRNLSTREVDLFFDEQEAQQVVTNTYAQITLTLWEKALFFFVWFAPWIPGGGLRMNYKEDRLALRTEQSKVFALAGFISLILDGFISVYFDPGIIFTMAILPLFFLIFQWLERK